MGGPGSGPRAKVRVADFDHPEEPIANGWRLRDFEGATFLAHVNEGSVSFDKYGGLRLTLTIPPEYVDAALDVHLLARSAVRLAVRMEVFKPYLHLVEQQAQRLGS